MVTPHSAPQPDAPQPDAPQPDAPQPDEAPRDPDLLEQAATDLARADGFAEGEVPGESFRNLVLQQLQDPESRRWAVYAAAPPVDEGEPPSETMETLHRWYREAMERLAEPEIGGGLLVGLAAMAFVVLLAPLPGLAGAFGDWVGDTFGLLTVAIPIALAVAGMMVVAERGDELPPYGRVAAGTAVVAIWSLGLLRVWLPARDLWGLDVATVTSGGNLGEWFTTAWLGFPVWLAVGALGFAILMPEHAERVAQTAPPALQRWALRLWARFRAVGLRAWSAAGLRARGAVFPAPRRRAGRSPEAGAPRVDGRATPPSSSPPTSVPTIGRAELEARLSDWETSEADTSPPVHTAGAEAHASQRATVDPSVFEAQSDEELQQQFRVARFRQDQQQLEGELAPERPPDMDPSLWQLHIALGKDSPLPRDAEGATGATGGYDARGEALGSRSGGTAVSPHMPVATSAMRERRRRRKKKAEPTRTQTTVPALTVLLLVLSLGVGWLVRGEAQNSEAQEAPASAAAPAALDDDGDGVADVPLVGSQRGPVAPSVAGLGEAPAGAAVIRNGGSGVWIYEACSADGRGSGLLADGTTVDVIAAGAGLCSGWAFVDVPDRGVQTWIPLDLLQDS